MTDRPWTAWDGGIRLKVRVVPRAGRTAIDGILGGALRIRLAAAPVEGAANAALVALLAERLGLRRAEIRILAGATTRTKLVELTGDAEIIGARLAAAADQA